MTPAELLDQCRSRGVELTTAGDQLHFRAPAGTVDGKLRAALRRHKSALIAIVAGKCALCGRPVGAKRQCWSCLDRACDRCGKPTGSAFQVYCYPCQQVGEREGWL